MAALEFQYCNIQQISDWSLCVKFVTLLTFAILNLFDVQNSYFLSDTIDLTDSGQSEDSEDEEAYPQIQTEMGKWNIKLFKST